MSAYITTGSPGSDTNNSQLIWKQSANLPDPDLLRHLYEVTFLIHASTPGFILLSQGRCLFRLSSPCRPAFTSIHVPFVSTSLPSLLCDIPLTHVFYSGLSLPQTHPRHPRAAVLHAICAVASVYSPAVSNPRLHGTRGKATSWPLSCTSGFLTVAIVFRRDFCNEAKRERFAFHLRGGASEVCG